jgi:hypothetical protein
MGDEFDTSEIGFSPFPVEQTSPDQTGLKMPDRSTMVMVQYIGNKLA